MKYTAFDTTDFDQSIAALKDIATYSSDARAALYLVHILGFYSGKAFSETGDRTSAKKLSTLIGEIAKKFEEETESH